MEPSLTAKIAAEWQESPYYDEAERLDWLEPFWATPRFRSKFDQLDIRRYLELACGHGRHTHYLLNVLKDSRVMSALLVDVLEENVGFCLRRFSSDPRVKTMRNNGDDLSSVPDHSVTALFSYDAMVHFEYDAVLSYIKEAYRVLEPGGKALMHHSNYDVNPGGWYRDNPHWRNFMSKSLFAHAAMRAGFIILEQEVTHWNHEEQLDCITLLERSIG